MVKLRITATGTDESIILQQIELKFKELKITVKEHLVTDKDEKLEMVVGRLLQERGSTLSTAESCTGGLIASMLTAIPGSSNYFKGSIVHTPMKLRRICLVYTNQHSRHRAQ